MSLYGISVCRLIDTLRARIKRLNSAGHNCGKNHHRPESTKIRPVLNHSPKKETMVSRNQRTLVQFWKVKFSQGSWRKCSVFEGVFLNCNKVWAFNWTLCRDWNLEIPPYLIHRIIWAWTLKSSYFLKICLCLICKYQKWKSTAEDNIETNWKY